MNTNIRRKKFEEKKKEAEQRRETRRLQFAAPQKRLDEEYR